MKNSENTGCGIQGRENNDKQKFGTISKALLERVDIPYSQSEVFLDLERL